MLTGTLLRTSQLLRAIDTAFRERGIEIAFQQMDLHLRSMDPPVGQVLSRSEDSKS